MVLAMINTVFAQENLDAAIAQWRIVANQLRDKFPKLAAMLDRSESEVLAYMSFQKANSKQILSTNPLERLNAEIRRRTDVVGIFPNEAAITRLVGALLLEQSDEWSLQRHYLQLEGLQTLIDNQTARLSAVTGCARAQLTGTLNSYTTWRDAIRLASSSPLYGKERFY